MSFDYLRFLKHLAISVIIIAIGVFIYHANAEFPFGLWLGRAIMLIGIVVFIWIGWNLNRYKKEDVEVNER